MSVGGEASVRTYFPYTLLAESGRLTPIPMEFYPLEQINEVAQKLKAGQIKGRAVIVP